MNCKLAFNALWLPLLFGVALAACSDFETTAETPREDARPTAEQNTGQGADLGAEPALPTSDTGVEGYLWIGPACPVVQLGSECPDLPFEAKFTVTDVEGQVVESSKSDESGFFRILLAPGSYIFVPDPSNPARSPRAIPVPFDVNDSSFTHLEVIYDSGLR